MPKINVSGSYAGVISTGPYENERPTFLASVEIEVAEDKIETSVASWQEKLFAISYDSFRRREASAIVERINKERSEFRFYYLPNGEPVPSVTSILSFDKDFFVSPADLRIMASEGSLRHAFVREFIKTGKMPVDGKDIEGSFVDYIVCKKANVPVDGNGFLAFLDKHPIEKLENGEQVISSVHRYGGTPDFWGTPKDCEANKKLEIEPIPTLADVKRTANPTENFMQIAAYIKASGRDVKQMLVVPLNNETKQGFSKPIVSKSVDQYFEMFLKEKREPFKKRYGI